ncbi:condensin complex subunit 2-like [Anopheles albimanus]|uniref:Condensin complex subunit 2 n=1 Tax=Anopheles albimanus TaxID=7167 RepID=A0A182FU04_ANOAL|nr:condensin complex subunit 2-like [Anopheles albimanus]
MTTTPLRKSRFLQTPQQAANDDEAERRIRRSEVLLDESVSSAVSTTAEDNENIKMCLKLYSDNKLSKENAWSLTIIDSFAKLISRHSKTLQNFQVAGSTLEASTKVYGLRVDSVHTDVMRMCSELTRQTARAMNNNAGEQDDAGGGGGGDDADASMAEGGNKENEGAGGQLPKAKKKRARKMVSTVTKSKESINAPLDTNPFTDPFFAKLNSVVGDVNSSSRLMQNIIPTKMSDLRLRMNYPFWDAQESPNLDLDSEPDLTVDEADMCKLHVQPIGPDNRLHELRCGYVITDAPAEDDEDDEVGGLAHMNDSDARAHEASIMDRSALDMQFDINADVEPVPSGDAFIIDYDAKDIDGNDDFAEDDEQALEQCKGLMRKTIQIEDMRPVDSSCSQLEYSYRPIDHISQFWAGPAHWKFKRSTMMRARNTMVASMGNETGSTSGSIAKERLTGRRRKRYEQDSLDDVFSVSEQLFQTYNPGRPLKGINSLKSSICKKWESKKLKLPTDYKLDRDRFDKWQYARGLLIRENRNVDVELSPSEEFSCDGGDDQISCGAEMDDGQDMGAMDNDVGFPSAIHPDTQPNIGGDAAPSQLHNETVDVISTEFKGAPDKVAKINIAYAKTAKVIDMKQLKYNCWRVINSYVTPEAPAATQPSQPSGDDTQLPLPPATQSADDRKIKFSKLYQKVPQLLSKSMSENISKALAFYAVLHLANEKSLRLEGQADLKDFIIMKAEE